MPLGPLGISSVVLTAEASTVKARFGGDERQRHRCAKGVPAVNMPHVAFATGPAVSNALDHLQATADSRSTMAERHVREFCARAKLVMLDAPVASQCVTASWCQEDSDAHKRLMLHARHHDLVVMSRANQPNGLQPDLIEDLLLGRGRPILLACSCSVTSPNDVVCWREDRTRPGLRLPF